MDPTSPPPAIPGHEFHFPVMAIALIGIVLTAILLLSYYIFVIKCCLNLHRVDVFNRLLARHHRSLDNDIASSATATPSPPGLDEAVIRSIPVIKFRKSASRVKINSSNNEVSNGETEFECAVCLCEFEEGEKLRVIPNCCHAFHIDCIDIWLQNCPNCPLCRTGISANSVLLNSHILKKYTNASNESNNSSRRTCEDEDGEYDDDDNYVVIEIQGNNLDEPRLISKTNSSNQEELKNKGNLNKKLGHVFSMGDELIDSIRKKDDEFQIQPIRRSISMDLSNNRDFCIEIHEHCTSSDNNTKEVARDINSRKNEFVSSSNYGTNNSKVRRSIFSFGYGRSSSGSVQPIQLDP